MKRIKLCLYGVPGVGKSVFALGAPNPFFITTDGNYEWLLEFGAKEEAHKQVYSWEEAKETFKSKELDKYDTIVVDLLEDLFKWCEYEFCKKNNLEHVSDIGFAKGYDITRNEFFIEISKLLALDKNIILIMHGITTVVKDRRGVEHTKYLPTSRIPDKVLDMIEGRVRYFLRCYLKAQENSDGTLIKKRFLSLVPKENEFGIIRGINENEIPHDISLDWNEFAQIIGFENEDENEEKPIKTKIRVKKEKPTVDNQEVKNEEKSDNPTAKDLVDAYNAKYHKEAKHETTQQSFEFEELTKKAKSETKIEAKSEVKEEVQVQESKEDKLAAIKAKLAAIKAQQNK